jgi:hypothetical protein
MFINYKNSKAFKKQKTVEESLSSIIKKIEAGAR